MSVLDLSGDLSANISHYISVKPFISLLNCSHYINVKPVLVLNLSVILEVCANTSFSSLLIV